MTPEQRAKLPRYAQDELRRLEQTVDGLTQALNPPSNANTRVHGYGPDHDRPLGNDVAVQWVMPDGTEYVVRPCSWPEADLEVTRQSGPGEHHASIAAVGRVSNVLGITGVTTVARRG